MNKGEEDEPVEHTLPGAPTKSINSYKSFVNEEKVRSIRSVRKVAADKLYAVINNTNAPSIATRFARRRLEEKAT